MKKILILSFIALSVSSSFACEPMQVSLEQRWAVERSLASDAYQEAAFKLTEKGDFAITAIDFVKRGVRVRFANKCDIIVSTKWIPGDGEGSCPQVDKITAETICK